MSAKAYNFAATFLCGKGDTNEGLNKTVYGNYTVTDSQAAPEENYITMVSSIRQSNWTISWRLSLQLVIV